MCVFREEAKFSVLSDISDIDKKIVKTKVNAVAMRSECSPQPALKNTMKNIEMGSTLGMV